MDRPKWSEQLNRLMEEKRITQKDLPAFVSERAGNVSDSTVYRWTVGKAKPSLEEALAIARCLGITLDEFVTGETLGSRRSREETAPGGRGDTTVAMTGRSLTLDEEGILWVAEKLGRDEAIRRLMDLPKRLDRVFL